MREGHEKGDLQMYSWIRILLLAFISMIICIPGISTAAKPVQRPDVTREAEIIAIQGDGWVNFMKGQAWFEAVRQQALTSGDLIKTGNYGKMSVLFADDTQIKIHHRTTLVIKEVRKAPDRKGTVLGLESGEIWSRAKSVSEELRIETPSATAAIRGTDWDIAVDEKGAAYLTVLRGSIEFYNDYGRVIVSSGEQAIAAIGKPPLKTVLVSPKDRVQWVISYPMNIPGLLPFYSHRRGEALKALPSVREKASKDPADLRTKLFLAGLLFDLKDRGESLRLFDEILVSDPVNCRALTFRGLFALDKGETEKAADYLGRAVGECREGEIRDTLLGMAGVHIGRGELGKAEELINNAAEKNASPVAGVVRAVFQAFLGNFARAIEISSEYEARYPDDERFPLTRAAFYLVTDEGAKARAFIETALKLNPASSDAYSELGGYYYLEGKGREAEEAFRKAIDLDPGNVSARNGLALLKMDQGYFTQAGEELSLALEATPRASMVWSNRGMLYNVTEALDNAKRDYERSVEIDPANYMALNGQGLVALKEGKTEEAVRYFLKSSVIEPRFAQPHTFLSIAYYQQGAISRALDEIGLAETLDPKDPYPHLIAYIIYQDTYRPFEAVKEARKVLELLPFLKSVEEIENIRSGLSNIGSALLGLGMSEWSENYAQEAFDPHNASSHFQASSRYNENADIKVSELIQGILLDPLTNSNPTRYQDIIRKPRNDVTVSSTLGSEGRGLDQRYSALAQGYVRKPWEIAYSLSLQAQNDAGATENGFSRGYSLNYGMGIKPDYDNGFNVGISAGHNQSGQPGSKTNPDPDDRLKTSNLDIDLGYHHRFGPKNDLLVRAAYDKTKFELLNDDPFGTGLTNNQMSFIAAGFDTQLTRDFFQKGVYDLTAILGGPAISLATDDSTGTFESRGIPRLSSAFPAIVDLDLRHSDKTVNETLLFQSRHLLAIGEDQELTYGIEYVPFRSKRTLVRNRISEAGTLDFYEEFIKNRAGILYEFPLLTSEVGTDEFNTKGKFVTAYLSDRWKLSKVWLVEGGVFFESFHDDNNQADRLYPRLGTAVKVLENHTLRVAFQRMVDKVSSGTLAPVGAAGLVVDDSLTLQGSRLTDYQVRVESRWSGRLFTAIGIEKVNSSDPEPGEGFPKRELSTTSLMASVNALLGKQTGLFLRYRYNESKETGDAFEGLTVPGVPRHLLNGGLVWVSPAYVKVLLSSTYAGPQFADYSNTTKLSGYWTTNLLAMWEPFKKHVLLSLSLNNIFKASDPAPARSAFFTLEYRL